MPSDSNGIYSLPAGYLGVTGTTIQVSQHNPPLEDIASALTARLMRSGAAPMTGVLKLVDGAVGAPAVALASAPTWGLYKTATGFGFAISGALAFEIQPNGALLANINIIGGTSLTTVAADDTLPIYDLSATANKRILVSDLFKVLTLLTAETAPAIDDELALYDLSATTTDKITLANLLKVVNGLTEDTAPDGAADFVLTYDNSASAAKKAKPTNLVNSAAGVAKAWGYFTSMSSTPPTVTASHNVASISRSNTGIYVVTFTTAFSSANFAVCGISQEQNRFLAVTAQTASTVTIRVENNAGTAVDPTAISVICFGAQ